MARHVVLPALRERGRARPDAPVAAGMLSGILDPLDQAVFQTVFGEIMTLLIALLAIARKFIVLDLHEVGPAEMLGLAAVALALGITYWLIRERDERRGTTPGPRR